jgi:dienelactone hydrolase
MDFGLAKQLTPAEGESEAETVSRTLTRSGITLGTLPYMSPEQVRSQALTTRSDIFSFGIVFYEMLTGVHPFLKETALATVEAILTEDFPSLSRYVKNLPKTLDRILLKMMAKEVTHRYESASGVYNDLEKVRFPQMHRKRRIAIVASVLIALFATAYGVWFFHRAAKARWATNEALPQIRSYVEIGNNFGAYSLAVQAEKYIPQDPLLLDLWPRISTGYSVFTTPEGAEIFFKEYSNIKDEWQYLGRSPLQNIRVPIGAYRWRIKRGGYRTLETVRATPEAQTEDFAMKGKQFTMLITREMKIILQKENDLPPRTLKVPLSAPSYLVDWLQIEPVSGPDFLMDQYEVTNREYRKFVDAGGYRKQQYWKQPMQMEQKLVSWEEAMGYFHDKSGRMGPSTWEGGTYPEGQDEYPVSGVSWYEAAAYAEFAGKSLPTIFHWITAARPLDDANVIIPLSNFSGKGPAAVGSRPGIGLHEIYDTGGNVREWCWNAEKSEDTRYTLGGSWMDPSGSFADINPRPAWDRSEGNGLRTVTYPSTGDRVPERLFDPVAPPPAKAEVSRIPVSDAEFELYKSQYLYDPSPLNARLEESDDSSRLWRREKISFDTAYGNERIIVYLFLPKGVKPPYKTIVMFPDSLPLILTSSEKLGKAQGQHAWAWEFLVLNGRALLFPVYQWTFERGPGPEWVHHTISKNNRIAYRDWVIQLFKDLGRSIDYLEERDDIDTSKLAYYGSSWGSAMGPINLALEKRLKAGVFTLCGARGPGLPAETDPINFAPHVDVPVLMICGEGDFYRYGDEPRKVFQLFRTPNEKKTLRILAGGHDGTWGLFTSQTRKEILDWLDRHQGKVE